MLDETIYGYWWYDTGAYIYYFCYDYSAGEWWQDADGDMGTDDWVLYDAAGTSFVPPFDLPNDSPVNIVPGAQTTDEDTPLIFSIGEGNAITVSDPDTGVYPLEVELTVTNGTLTLSGVSGLTFRSGDNGAASMTFQGSADDINDALNGLVFDPTVDFNGTVDLTITTDDLGHIGTGGAQTDTDALSITVSADNTQPTTSGISDVTVDEDAPDTAFSLFPFFDDVEDADSAMTYTVESNSNWGLFTSVNISDPENFTLDYSLNAYGTADITVRATDTGGLWVESTFTVTVTQLMDDLTTCNVYYSASTGFDELTVFDGDVYFRANDGSHGWELWRYDPDTDSATLVADIFPGAGNSSDPSYLTVFDGDLYFRASDGEYGQELWRYDPDTDSATLAADIWSGSNGSYPEYMTVFDGDLYFRAYDGVHGQELWRYDPDTNSATLAADIWPGSNGSSPAYLTVFDGDLYFGANAGFYGQELWRYDPDTDSATLAAEIWPDTNGSYPEYLTVLDGDLYFRANDGANGQELWRYDPDTDSATLAAEIWSETNGSYPEYLTVFDGDLYFGANDGVHGKELWRYDPDTDSATLAADIWSGSNGSSPEYLTVFGGDLYFEANDGAHGQELWRYDPDTDSATLAADIRPGVDSSIPRYLTATDSDLYFMVYNGSSGYEIRRLS
jgi:ELWxxDGT repeat protein